MSEGKASNTRSDGRLHPLVRVLAYFVALAIVNRIAFAGVAALLP